MTLIDLADSLHADALAVGEIRRGRERTARFASVAAQIQELANALEWASWFIPMMAEQGLTRRANDVRTLAIAGRAKLSRARLAFEADPSWLIEGRNASDLIDDLKKFRQFLTNEGSELWNDYRKAIPVGERQLVAPLLTHTSATVRADAAAYLANEPTIEAAQSPSSRPADQGDWARLQKALRERDRLRAALPVEADPEIRAFVADCQGEGARLEQLTAKVLGWLQESGQADTFWIHSRKVV